MFVERIELVVNISPTVLIASGAGAINSVTLATDAGVSNLTRTPTTIYLWEVSSNVRSNVPVKFKRVSGPFSQLLISEP